MTTNYSIFDPQGKLVKKVGQQAAEQSTTNTTGRAIASTATPRELPRLDPFAPGAQRGHRGRNRSERICHLANVAYRAGHTLRCDPKNGHILDDTKAQALWGRSYEPGWEPEGAKGTA